MKKSFKKCLLVIIFSALCSFVLHTKWISLHVFYDTLQPTVVYKHRNSIVNHICALKNYTNRSLPLDTKVAAQLYVEHSHKFIYCEVPKVGCSNWKRIILLLNNSSGRTINELGHYEVHSSPLLTKLSSYSLAKQKELLSNYTKVMFTRDPLERVVSAYRDKFLHDDDVYYSKTMAAIIRRRLKTKHNDTDNITFKEFASFIVVDNPEYRDTHWKPMYQLCDPCKIHYDIIGKYETLTQDADFVLKIIKAPKNLKYPSIKHHSNDSRTNEEIIRQYLKMLPPDLFRQLLNVYSVDRLMFEYDHFYSLKHLG